MGNPVTVKDARNTTLGYVYDALGRRTEERLGSTTGTVRAKWVFDTLQRGRVLRPGFVRGSH